MAQSSLGVVITPDMAGDDATADCQYGLPCQHAKMLWNEHRTNEVQYPSLFQPHSTSCAASTTLEKSLSHGSRRIRCSCTKRGNPKTRVSTSALLRWCIWCAGLCSQEHSEDERKGDHRPERAILPPGIYVGGIISLTNEFFGSRG